MNVYRAYVYLYNGMYGGNYTMDFPSYDLAVAFRERLYSSDRDVYSVEIREEMV